MIDLRGGTSSDAPSFSMKLQRSLRLTSMRGKLLAIGVGLVLVFLCSLWVAAWGLRTVIDAASAVHEQTLPRLLQYQQIAHASRSVVDTTRALPRASTHAELDILTDKLDEIIASLESHSRALRESPGELRETISRLKQFVASQREQVIQLLHVRADIATRTQLNLDSLGKASDFVDDLLLLEQSEGRSGVDLARVQDGLYRLIDLEQELITCRDVVSVDGVQSRIRMEFVGLGPSLTRLRVEDSEALAKPLLDALERTGDAEGSLGLTRRRIALENQLDASAESASALIQDLEGLASDASVALTQESLTTRQSMESAQSSATQVMFGLLIAVLFALIITGIYVQREILVRLRRMVSELTALSQGELGVRVTPGGDRELAELADAAEIFRGNAEDLSRALKEVEASNAELAQFAYVASHDLKTPLRGIANLANWVIEDCEDQLPEESRGHLHRLVERTHRMENLLEDLLRYSRVGREQSPEEEIELGETIRQIVDFVAPEGGLELEIENPELTIVGQRPPLELALRNLLANSLSHSDRKPVHVQAKLQRHGEAGFELDLIDDGPGIPFKYAERVFGMFTRLSHDESGTGMGLALVRRIAESVGGSAQVVERSGRGAHIRLVWPMNEESKPKATPRDASTRPTAERASLTAEQGSA